MDALEYEKEIEKLESKILELESENSTLQSEIKDFESGEEDLKSEIEELEERIAELENVDLEDVTFCGVEIRIECDNMAVKSFLERFTSKHEYSNVNQLEILI